MIFLPGGPSHQDMWDIKTDAPSKVRGEFHAIETKVPGIQIGELFPKNAATASKGAKAELVKKVAAAKTALDTATKNAATATARTTAATKAKTSAIAVTKAATAKAKVKDLKFAVYSAPITIEIKKAGKVPAKK